MAWIVIAAVCVLIGYIRLAPSDPVRWHTELDFASDETLAKGVRRVVEIGPEAVKDLHQIIMAAPRTTQLRGKPADLHITYITRSLVLGFPDYTTIQHKDGKLLVYARLRFGRSDLGVNGRRVDRWLADLQSG